MQSTRYFDITIVVTQTQLVSFLCISTASPNPFSALLRCLYANNKTPEPIGHFILTINLGTSMIAVLRRRKDNPSAARCYVSIWLLFQQCQTAGIVGKDFLSIVLGDHNGGQLVDENINLVVVHLNIGSGHTVACLQGLDDLDSLSNQSIGGLCNGGVLTTGPDPLNGLVLSVQTGDSGNLLTCLLAGGDDRTGDAVVGRQDTVDFLVRVES